MMITMSGSRSAGERRVQAEWTFLGRDSASPGNGRTREPTTISDNSDSDITTITSSSDQIIITSSSETTITSEWLGHHYNNYFSLVQTVCDSLVLLWKDAFTFLLSWGWTASGFRSVTSRPDSDWAFLGRDSASPGSGRTREPTTISDGDFEGQIDFSTFLKLPL